MGRYLCQLCDTIVQYGERHPCFFYKDEETVYIVPQLDETEEVDTNYNETTAYYAENSDDHCGYMCETIQHTRDASQVSTSLQRSVSSTGNNKVDEGSLEVSLYFTDHPVSPETSFHTPNRKGEIDTRVNLSVESKEKSVALQGPSTAHLQTLGERRYDCDLCAYRSKTKGGFTLHYRTHTGEKPYVCDTCGKGFSQKGSLKSHERTHTGEKPYKCGICGRDFAHNAHLIAHMRRHTGEKPYVCKTCGKNFTQKGTLDSHLRTHTGEKPYSCDICGRSFSKQSSCRRHVTTHHRDMRYKC